MTAPKRLSDEEWLRRYNEYFRKKGNWEGNYSDGHPNDNIEQLRDGFDDEPEEAAHEEMTYWDTENDE